MNARTLVTPRWVLTSLLLVVLSCVAGPVGAAPPEVDRAAFDPRVGGRECALLGRVYDARLGCARDRCIPPAVPFKRSPGTEMCALPGQGRYGYAAAIDYRRCAILNRRWLTETDWCASNPDRRVGVIREAPQCIAPASTYVSHDETEGWYDECLRPRRVAQLQRIAKANGTSVEHEAALRSETLCAYRPGHVFASGVCQPRRTAAVQAGGTLLVGDSLTWRGTDELGGRAPDISLDGLPSRQLRDLSVRLDRFRLDHGEPANLIIELGTNRDRTYSEQDLRQDIASLPTSTLVMFVLPYRADRAVPSHVQQSSISYSDWMTALAAERPLTCIANWRAIVEKHPGVLGDGVHPRPALERFWAKWLNRSWDRCQAEASPQRADS